jgi:hypothetical protein
MQKTLERSGSSWLPSRREMLGALGVGLLAPRIARAATFALVTASAIIIDNSGSGWVTSNSIDTTGADLLVGIAMTGPSDTHIAADTKGNLAQWATVVQQTNSGSTVFLYACAPTSVGAGHTISFNGGGPAYGAFYFAAFSGAKQTTPLDGSSGAIQTTGSTVSPGAVIPSLSNELLVSVYGGGWGARAPVSVDSEFSLVAANNTGSGQQCAWGYVVQLVAASINPTWTAPDSGTAKISLLAAFKSTSSSGGAAPPVRRRVITGGE